MIVYKITVLVYVQLVCLTASRDGNIIAYECGQQKGAFDGAKC